MAGHFYPLPPTFIGGRQPYAPKLGIAQSGPPSQPTRALATLGIILASWSQATPALPSQVRIAPLLPVVDTAPPRSTANLNLILAQWHTEHAPLPPRSDIAPLLPVVSDPPRRPAANINVILAHWDQDASKQLYRTQIAALIPAVEITANPPYTRKQFENIDDAWRYDPTTVITLTSIAPFADAPAVPDAAPQKGRVTLDLIRAQWKARDYLPPQPKGLAPLLPPAAVPDAAPLRSHALLKSILDQSQPPLYRPQTVKPIAALIPAAVAPDMPPPASFARSALLQQWEPATWWPLPRNSAFIPPASDAAPAPSGVNLATIIERWRASDLRLPVARGIAPLIQSAPDLPPASTDVMLRLIIEQWHVPAQSLPQVSRIAAYSAPAVPGDAPLPIVQANFNTIVGWWEQVQSPPDMYSHRSIGAIIASFSYPSVPESRTIRIRARNRTIRF